MNVLARVPSPQIVHRSFRTTESPCINVGWLAAMSYVLDGDGRHVGYTHLWKFDADLEFGHFNFRAFAALVAFGAPFVSQPAILPQHKGMRSSDRSELHALFAPTHYTNKVGPTAAVTGRERLVKRGWANRLDAEPTWAGLYVVKDDVDIDGNVNVHN